MVRILTRHVCGAFLRRAAGLAALAAGLGALVGGVEAANRPDGAAWAGWLEGLGRVPETVFFAGPVWVLLAVLWTTRDVVPPGVSEGLGGAGVPARRVDGGILIGTAAALGVLAAFGGWLAPWAQRATAPDPAQAWARSGGAPGWSGTGRTWIRLDERLVRVSIGEAGTRIDRWWPEGGAPPGADPLPSAADLALLSSPPAWMTLPGLWRAAAVRERYGHLRAPVDAELALRGVLLLLVLPAGLLGCVCRRMRNARWRWAWATAWIVAGLLGLQAANVWAARGELPAAAVVWVPLLAAGIVWAGAAVAARRAG